MTGTPGGKNRRIDDLGRRGYRIYQDPSRFCFGADAAFLAWFAKAKEGERVLDLCSGTGIVPILMDARYGCGDYTGLEILPDMAEMANDSAALNGIAGHMRFVQGDVKETGALFGRGSFDVVTVNPPYMPAGTGLVNPDDAKAIARHEVLCTLEDVVKAASGVLKSGGRLYMVHRPARLPGILKLMKEYRLAPARLCFIHSYEGKEASMLLLAAVKGGRSLLKVEPPVIVYKEPHVYTEQVRRIYEE